MKLLAVESAFEACSVALIVDGEVTERRETAPRSHARCLLPFVRDLLGEADLALAELDAVAFTRGPGSFTSLRIGIGVVQGLAWGAGLPVLPVSSLQVTAQGVISAGHARVCVAMDARMDEVYTACFEARDGLFVPVTEERVCAPEAALPEQPGDWAGAGTGFARFPHLSGAPMAACIPEALPHAPVLAEIAAARLAAGEPGLPPDQAQPVYLRNKVADKPGARGA